MIFHSRHINPLGLRFSGTSRLGLFLWKINTKCYAEKMDYFHKPVLGARKHYTALFHKASLLIGLRSNISIHLENLCYCLHCWWHLSIRSEYWDIGLCEIWNFLSTLSIMPLHSLVGGYQGLGETCYLHLQSSLGNHKLKGCIFM